MLGVGDRPVQLLDASRAMLVEQAVIETGVQWHGRDEASAPPRPHPGRHRQRDHLSGHATERTEEAAA
jgi:hypothetical protein